MTTKLFLPWMRTGLAGLIGDTVTPGDVATFLPEITVEADDDTELVAGPSVHLRGPGDVLSLNIDQIKRRDPEPGSSGSEPQYFCSVEFFAADLPWRYTPYDASGDQLPPWLVLVVVDLAEEAALESQTRTTTLTVYDAAAHLPDLTEAWAWAHVQTESDQGRDISAAYESSPETFTSRLLCPRRLKTGATYTACIVPAYEAGRLAGLGSEPGTPDGTLAWTPASNKVVLPVYDSWSFTVGNKLDFKSLARRIKPAELPPDVGFRDLDLTDVGEGIDKVPSRVTFVGAMYSPAGELDYWEDSADQAAFADQVRARIDAPAKGRFPRTTYDPLVHDPAVAPPVYGAPQVGTHDVPATAKPTTGWFEDLNLGPQHRSVAGLGVEVVRSDQEALMAAAWEESHVVTDVNRQLNRGRLAYEAGLSAQTKLDAIDDATLVALSSPALVRMHVEDSTAKRAVLDGDAPMAYFGSTFRRLGRTNGPLSTKADLSAAKAPAIAIADALLAAASGDTTVESPLSTEYRTRYLPPGMDVGVSLTAAVAPISLRSQASQSQTGGFVGREGRTGIRTDLLAASTATLLDIAEDPSSVLDTRFEVPPGDIEPMTDGEYELDAVTIEDFALDMVRPASEGRIVTTPAEQGVLGVDLAAVARNSVQPAQAIATSVLSQVVLPIGVAPGFIPTRVGLEPRFTDPMYERLRALSVDYLVPGVGQVPNNKLGLLALNPAYIEAFMVGLNHEMSREFRWREYPAALSQTWFQHFFDNVASPETPDIEPIDLWPTDEPLGETFGPDSVSEQDDPSLVLLIKADLVRKFPDVRVYAVPAILDGTLRVPDPNAPTVGPTFAGSLQKGVNFYGFLGLTESQARGDDDDDDQGYFFVFEEEARAMRFGLDIGAPRNRGEPPKSWANLTWWHLAETDEDVPEFCPIDVPHLQTGLGDPEWGTDAAHMGAITFRRPIQVFIHASSMLPDS